MSNKPLVFRLLKFLREFTSKDKTPLLCAYLTCVANYTDKKEGTSNLLFGFIKVLESTIGSLFSNFLPLQYLIYPFMKFIVFTNFSTNPNAIEMLLQLLDHVYNVLDNIGAYDYTNNVISTNSTHQSKLSLQSPKINQKKKDKMSDDENENNKENSNGSSNVNREELENEISSTKSKKQQQISMIVTISNLRVENIGTRDLQCELIVLPPGDREKEGAELVRFKTGVRIGTEVEFNDPVKIEPVISLDGELKIVVKHSPTFGDVVPLFEMLIPMKSLNHLSQEPKEFTEEGEIDIGLEDDEVENGDANAAYIGNYKNRIFLKGMVQFKPFTK